MIFADQFEQGLQTSTVIQPTSWNYNNNKASEFLIRPRKILKQIKVKVKEIGHKSKIYSHTHTQEERREVYTG